MKEKPILFSTNMVQAILRGEKTQTRRLCKFYKAYDIFHDGKHEVEAEQTFENIMPCKYKVGDILWVRETWQHTKCLNINFEDENYGYVYKADGQPWEDIEGWTWKPSIFMPKEACRIKLEITDIRIERLNDISREDAINEGIEFQSFYIGNSGLPKPIGYKIYGSKNSWDENPIVSYWSLWDQINGKDSWNCNPWIWVIKFKKL